MHYLSLHRLVSRLICLVFIIFTYQATAQQAKLFYAMDQFPTEGASTLVDLASSTPAKCANTTTNGIPEFVRGKGGYSLSAWDFANTDASIQVPANTITATLGDISATTGFSIGFWVNLDYVEANHVFSRIAGLGSVFDIMTSGDKITFRFKGSDYSIATVPADGALDGTWQHLVVSLDYTSTTDNLVIYQNGIATHTASYNVGSSFNSATASMFIGGHGFAGGYPFHGKLDDFIVFDEAINLATAQNLYQNGGYQFCGADGYPTKKAGGYDYNWSNYTTDPYDGIGERVITPDYTGAREIYHTPPVGIHPRVYFSPEEVFDLRDRMDNLKSGKSVMRQAHAYTTLMIRETYDINAPYARDDFGERFISNAGYWNNRPAYEFLLEGNPADFFNNLDTQRAYLLGQVCVMEALECLINKGGYDPDTGLNYDDRARDLALIQTKWAQVALDNPGIINEVSWQWFPGPHQGLIYDINYHMMTDEQRDIVRQAIAQVTPPEPIFGKGLSCYSTTSNWSTLNSFEIIPNLAIEGEAGYKPNLTHDWMRILHNFITYGWYDSGACFEALGKNQQFAATLTAFARMGYSLVGYPSVRAYGMKYLPAIMQPFGHSFTDYDLLAGSGFEAEQGGYKFNVSDAIGMKWLYPDNPQTDFVWRNYISSWKYVGTQYWQSISSTGYVYQQVLPGNNYYCYMPVAIIFAQDYDERDFDVVAEDAVVEDYFAGDRGLAIMRSGKDSLSLQTQFHCRQNYGGHTFADRNDFTLSGLGRIWVRKTFGAGASVDNYFHSSVLVDDISMHDGVEDIRLGGNCRIPAKIIDYQSGNDMSCVTGDATFTYTWEFAASDSYGPGEEHPWIGLNGWEVVTESWNDFMYEPHPEAIYNTSYYDFPNWRYPDKLGRYLKRPFNPMERVVRTAAMVRGNNPFMLIVDDIEKDDNVHNYKWATQIANDLTIESTDVNLDDCDYRNDIILKEPGTTGNRRLLVRILNNEGYDGSGVPGYIDTLKFVVSNGDTIPPINGYDRFRLVVESNSVAPDFKVLLYPHHDGDALPETTWNTSRDSLIVRFSNDEKRIAFVPQEGGRWNKVELLATSTQICDCTQDTDNDGICDLVDPCVGGDNNIDTDSDTIPDACDSCPNSALNDANMNNICDQLECTLVSENFDYAVGSAITDAAGGSGLTNTWTTNGSDATISFESGSLTYTGIANTGNKLHLQANSNYTSLVRDLSTNNLTAGKTVWVSFLMKANTVGNGHFFIKPAQSQALAIGKRWGSNFAIDNNDTGIAVAAGQTYWVVARYLLGDTDDTVHLWLNPDASVEPDPSTAIATKTAPSILPINTLEIDLQHHGQGDYEIDALRISCEYPMTSSIRNLNVKVLLQGPYDTGTLMRDNLANILPTKEPYSSLGYNFVGTGGNEQITANAINNTGNKTVVDWSIVELRNMTDPSIIVASRAALLLADGNIVDTDGQSPLAFQVPAGMYYVAVRHRNHLAVMTGTAVFLE